MLNVNTKAQLFENSSLHLDHLILEGNVILIQNQRCLWPKKKENVSYTLNLRNATEKFA